ncbi:hypothetical protein [Nocardioides coralli]|uniref:hypothetical protein n=1 Tax=Nocardioides coralli TaxID=2872154 RepID=UPI001CA3BC7C|nr:hypothetical protein [Nocardioides coralli]QZY29425.1 hypothetical protein K6T13_01585 [Nocardioides coralli]
MTRRVRALPGTVLLVALLSSCSEEPPALGDQATCPGPSCTDDARERLEALADLTDVTEVEEVSRSSRLDRGSSSTALVRADVATAVEARVVATEVLRVLDRWPEHDAATSLATVRSDPPRQVAGAARESEELDPAFFTPCSAEECAAALTELEAAVEDAYAGVDVSTVVEDGRLLVSGDAPREQAALAARGALRTLRELGVRVAERAQVVLRWRAPLSVTLRLQDGLVCEQPPGVVVRCGPDNSEPFSG